MQLDLGTASMLHAYWLTDGINFFGIRIWYQMTSSIPSHTHNINIQYQYINSEQLSGFMAVQTAGQQQPGLGADINKMYTSAVQHFAVVTCCSECKTKAEC